MGGREEGLAGYGSEEERVLQSLSFYCHLIGQGAGQKQGLELGWRWGLETEAHADWPKSHLSGVWSQESSSLEEREEIA